MSCKEYGTLTDFVTVELSVSSEAQKTGLFATEIKDGKLSIKVVTKGSIEDTTEASADRRCECEKPERLSGLQ